MAVKLDVSLQLLNDKEIVSCQLGTSTSTSSEQVGKVHKEQEEKQHEANTARTKPITEPIHIKVDSWNEFYAELCPSIQNIIRREFDRLDVISAKMRQEAEQRDRRPHAESTLLSTSNFTSECPPGAEAAEEVEVTRELRLKYFDKELSLLIDLIGEVELNKVSAIVDAGHVKRVRCTDTGRVMWQVRSGNKGGIHYVVLDDSSYCSCDLFRRRLAQLRVGDAEAARVTNDLNAFDLADIEPYLRSTEEVSPCKHMTAVRLAKVLQIFEIVTVNKFGFSVAMDSGLL